MPTKGNLKKLRELAQLIAQELILIEAQLCLSPWKAECAGSWRTKEFTPYTESAPETSSMMLECSSSNILVLEKFGRLKRIQVLHLWNLKRISRLQSPCRHFKITPKMTGQSPMPKNEQPNSKTCYLSR